MSSIRSILRAGAVAATVSAAVIGWAASAQAVIHNGDILSFTNLGGVGFSYLHDSKDGMGHKAFYQQKILNNPVTYTWDLSGVTSGIEGARAIFDQAETHLLSRTTGGNRFEVFLEQSDNSVLTVFGAKTNFSGTPTVTNSVGGTLEFRIDQFDSNDNLVASILDEFIFSENMSMGPINGAGEQTDGSVNIFLWGDTGLFADNAPSCEIGVCSDIVDAFFNDNTNGHGLGIDLAFSGISAVPVPAALPLLGTALAGIVIVGRRRRKFTA